MRIGFFTDTYTPQINGVVTSICLFKRALEARGHDIFVFAPGPAREDDNGQVLRFRSVPFVFQPEMRFAAPVSVEALRKLDDLDLDIAHSHDPFNIGLFGLTVARRERIPYVHTYHTLYPEYVHYVWETRLTKKLAERLSRDFCQRCTSIIAPSTKVERHLRDWGVKVPVDVIATGIDVSKYSTADASRILALRQAAGIEPGDKVLLFMGRLGREKNVELLLRALWHARTPDIKLVVCGDGPHRAELEALVDELDLRQRVSFVGYLEGPDSVAAYHIANAFSFASTTETQGLVIGEAMAAGLPVIAVEDHAVEDFVVSGKTGLIVPAVPEAMARAFDRVLNDESLLTTMARASRERAVHFSIEHEAERLEQHYLRAIELRKQRKRFVRLALPRPSRRP